MFLHLGHTRGKLLGVIFAFWLAAIASILAFTGPSEPVDPVVVTHWASSHLMKVDLLPEMAARFNQAGHRTASGRPIIIDVHDVPPALQAKFLTVLLNDGMRIPLGERAGMPIAPDIADPTIVTPSSAHWFVQVNYEVGHDVVDLANARSIVRPFVGIVTYRDMAACLGWPEKDLSYQDILDLREDLLHLASRCEATLNLTRIQVVGIKTGGLESSIDPVVEALKQTVSWAREVQEELQKLGY